MKKLIKRASILFTALLTLSVGTSYTVKEVKAADEKTYTKVTSLSDITEGEYVITYTDVVNNKVYVFDGRDIANGYVTPTSFTNTDIVISSEYSVNLTTNGEGFNIQINAENANNASKYIYGTSGSNKLNFGSSEQLNTISEGKDEETFAITSNTSVLTFNSTSNNMRFRYYKSSTATGTSYKSVCLYKLNKNVVQETINYIDTDLSNQLTTASLSFDYNLEYGSVAYQLVTDASKLIAGDKLIMASNTKGVVAGDITSQYLSTKAAIFSENLSTIESAADAVVFTLGGSANAWTLANEEGKLLGATAVKKLSWDASASTWSISIDEANNATIQNNNSSYGRFLHNAGSPRFTTYATTTSPSSSMLLPQLYRVVTVESDEETLVSQSYDNIKIKFGAEVSTSLFTTAPTAAGVIVSQKAIATGASDTTLEKYLTSNSSYKDLSVGAPTSTDNKYSVAGAIQVYADGVFASATDEKLTTELTASVYFVVDGKIVILKSINYSVKTMLETYIEKAEELNLAGNTLKAVEAFNAFIA